MLPYISPATLRLIHEERISSAQRWHPIGAERAGMSGTALMRMRRSVASGLRRAITWLGSDRRQAAPLT